ncbi:hypothetical protein QFZ75_007926 [Streptomyces sp. V3I8]|uniref:hypothetical protein n=1 Tax=Streptomyces sp. V3I8 TaxID=3042279 RepID=UPI002780CBC2|nr:hypothetical protein [Streptomyces sp. V3I8]MDQ1041424.1 hypothetical protein [Streptomyces sp. V3I8]
MTDDDTNPIIIEPYVDTRKADPKKNIFILYDEDFLEETDPRRQSTDPDRPLRQPHFSIGEIGPWVFGRNVHWLRNETKNHPLMLNGKRLVFRFTTGGRGGGERRLTLPDIERLAWALFQGKRIDGVVLQRATQILSSVAHQHGALRDKNGKRIR